MYTLFQPPQEPDPFDGVFMADKLESACEQTLGLIQLTNPGWTDISEDCLHLSIYTPAVSIESWHLYAFKTLPIFPRRIAKLL